VSKYRVFKTVHYQCEISAPSRLLAVEKAKEINEEEDIWMCVQTDFDAEGMCYSEEELKALKAANEMDEIDAEIDRYLEESDSGRFPKEI